MDMLERQFRGNGSLGRGGWPVQRGLLSMPGNLRAAANLSIKPPEPAAPSSGHFHLQRCLSFLSSPSFHKQLRRIEPPCNRNRGGCPLLGRMLSLLETPTIFLSGSGLQGVGALT